jgi:hypothetical protein
MEQLAAKYPKGTEVAARNYQVEKHPDLEGLVGTVLVTDGEDFAVEWPGLGIWMHKRTHLIAAANAWRKPGGFQVKAS